VCFLFLLLRPDQEKIKGAEDDGHGQKEAKRVGLLRALCVRVTDEKIHENFRRF
jgi:hypothetical protein